MARLIVYAAVAAACCWVVVHALTERDFWWLVLLGFAAGSLGPWLLIWLHEKWSDLVSTSSSFLDVTTCGRQVSSPSGSDSHALWEGQQGPDTWVRRESSSSSPAGSSEASAGQATRKLVPDPEQSGRWKYVSVPADEIEADDEEEHTPRLGPPTPPVPHRVMPPAKKKVLPPASHTASLVVPKFDFNASLKQTDGSDQCETPPVAVERARGKAHLDGRRPHTVHLSQPAPSQELPGAVTWYQKNSVQLQPAPTRAADRQRPKTVGNAVMEQVLAFEAKFTKDKRSEDETAFVPNDVLRRVEQKGFHMTGRPVRSG
mmetsp:Transcript_37890/g.109229  ORF Transcript_37890/g.109229 Transcript_37890/m.109229 type:complete len:316 (+) Transcript_37890:48-995(+)